jgi:hypothetical protein
MSVNVEGSPCRTAARRFETTIDFDFGSGSTSGLRVAPGWLAARIVGCRFPNAIQLRLLASNEAPTRHLRSREPTPVLRRIRVSQTVQDFAGGAKKKDRECGPKSWITCAKWSGRKDLNLRPPAPHAGALPGCATPRRQVFIIAGSTVAAQQLTDFLQFLPYSDRIERVCVGPAGIRLGGNAGPSRVIVAGDQP